MKDNEKLWWGRAHSPLTMNLKHRDDGNTHWKVLLRNGKTWPLSTRYFRFAAMNSDDDRLTSRPWKIDADPRGNVYVRTRGGNGDAHISLHPSGEAHMKGASHQRRGETCHWTWTHGKPALEIVFLPRWGAPIADRPDEKLWNRNDCLIGLDQDWGFTVSLARLPTEAHYPGRPEPPRRINALAQMEMPEAGETLWVWAEQIYPPFDDVEAVEQRLTLEAALNNLRDALHAGETVLDLHLMGTKYGGTCGFVCPFQVIANKATDPTRPV